MKPKQINQTLSFMFFSLSPSLFCVIAMDGRAIAAAARGMADWSLAKK